MVVHHCNQSFADLPADARQNPLKGQELSNSMLPAQVTLEWQQHEEISDGLMSRIYPRECRAGCTSPRNLPLRRRVDEPGTGHFNVMTRSAESKGTKASSCKGNAT
eukprot:2755228-Pleurochrysis_carterae.AAC.2